MNGRELFNLFIMLTKIKSLFDVLNLRKDRSGKTLVSLISKLIHNTGLCSFIIIYKVHWVANVCTFCFFITCVLQVIALFIAKGDPSRLFECFSVLSFCSMGVLKLFSLRIDHQRLRFILVQITKLENEQLDGSWQSCLEYQSDSEEGDNFSDYITNYTDKFRSTANILTRIYSLTAVIFILSPFTEYFLCLFRGMECVDLPHILPGWAPLDQFNVFGYLITVVLEFIAAVYCVCVHVAFDLTAFGVMIFVCGQFSLLRDYSSRIGGKGRRCNFTKKRDDRAHFRIMKCHHIHIILANTITELDKLLKNILGVYFFVATLTLCVVAVRFQSDTMSIMELVSLIQYMCATLIQLFLFCRYGNAVLDESTVIMGQGPFGAAWWCLSPRIRRELTILGAAMMQPRQLRAGPFNYLNLPSFIQIVRAAYSYYAVLGK